AISSGGTVTVAAGTVTATGANSLTGGTLSGAGTFTIGGGTFTWHGGSMTGTGATNVLAGATLAQTGIAELRGGRRLTIEGLHEIRGNVSIGSDFAAPPRLHVAPTGVLRKTAGTGRAGVSAPLRNDGVVDSVAGELELGPSAGVPHTGTFSGASEAARVSFGFSFPVTPHVLADSVNLSGWTEIGGGTVEIPAGAAVEVSDHLALIGGELGGAGTLDVTGALPWGRGTQSGPGTTAIAAGGVVTIDGDPGCFVSLEDGRRIVNHGTLRVTGRSHVGAFSGAPAVIENAGRIEIDDTVDRCGDFHGILGDMLVTNTGTIEKLGGTSTALLDATLDNAGSVVVSAGTLSLGGAVADVPQRGSFTAEAVGARLDFEDGTFVLAPQAALAGDVGITGARLEVAEAATLAVPIGDTLRLESGVLAGPGEVRIAGTLAWADGDHEGPGTTVVEAGGTVAVGGDEFSFASLAESRALVNRGSVTVGEGGLFVGDGATVFNAGTLTLAGAAPLSGSGFGFGFGSLLHNTGTLRKTGAGTAEAELPIDNDGTIEVAGGVLETSRLLNLSTPFATSGTLTGGTYVVRPGTDLVLPAGLQANAARIVLDGAGSRLLRPDFGGGQVDALAPLVRNTAAGRLELTGARSLTLPDSLLNAGDLRIGAGSTLTTGGFRQAAGGVLRAALTGTLASSGTATLAGRLDVLPGTTPNVGDEFVVVDATTSGTFASVTGTDLGTRRLEVRYEPPGVKLRVVAAVVGARGDGAPAPSEG
ncbi:MAG: hypothetical protein ACRDPC_27775, partial [Solirubrobacteraceae bacterium]